LSIAGIAAPGRKSCAASLADGSARSADGLVI